MTIDYTSFSKVTVRSDSGIVKFHVKICLFFSPSLHCSLVFYKFTGDEHKGHFLHAAKFH